MAAATKRNLRYSREEGQMSSTSGLLPESSGSARALLASTTRFSTRVPVRLGPNGALPEGNRKGKLAKKAMVTLDEFTPEMLESERAALLVEKQTLLETVNDRHDNLVRRYPLFCERN